MKVLDRGTVRGSSGSFLDNLFDILTCVVMFTVQDQESLLHLFWVKV